MTVLPAASGGWASLTADLSAYTGQTVLSGSATGQTWQSPTPGFIVDDIAVDGGPARYGAEDGIRLELNGFIRNGSVVTKSFFNAYLAEFRTVQGLESLETGPYNFGFLETRPWVTMSSISRTRTAC